MKKNHTLLIIDPHENEQAKYKKLLNGYFHTIITAKNEQEAMSVYLHYLPDAVLLGSGVLNDYYKKFLSKIKKHLSTPVVIMIHPAEMDKLYKVFDYNFSYCILDNDYKINLLNCMEQTVQKIDIIKQLHDLDSIDNINSLAKYESSLNKSSVPTIICSGNIDDVRCNSAFTTQFGLNQEQINQHVLTQDFLNRLELKDIIAQKDLTKEHKMVINNKKLKAKIYILRQYELYLITFNSISNENQVINLDLKKELEYLLERIDLNFDDHVKLQYDMINITSQIRSFLQTNTQDSIIQEWLNSNQGLMQNIEREFDYAILEELKMHTYLCAS